MVPEKLMKPAQFAEHKLLTAILTGEYKPGTILPGERKLAELIGVTRPTLRETLQKMSRDGWITIRHGKPTMVKDYMIEGGIGVLATMARFGEELPSCFVEHFLNVRCVVMPSVSKMAVDHDPERLEEYLELSRDLLDEAQAYTEYDWNLQLKMASLSGNPFFRIILNDFDFLYRKMGAGYFSLTEARAISKEYYEDLLAFVVRRDGKMVEERVARVMKDALDLWKTIVMEEGKSDESK
jgi:GntR family negative regulator for fad regulon and positive regulator of fabA